MNTVFVKFLVPTVLLGSLLTPLAAQAAGHHNDPINARLRHQHARINQGLRNGKLSKHEAHRLKGRDAVIHRLEARDRREHHGHLTGSERRYLNGQLNRNSHAIYREKHGH